MKKSIFPILIAAVIFLLFGANAVFGQCGLPGTPPCPTAPKPKPKPKPKPTVAKPKPTVAKPKPPAKPKPAPKQKCSPSDNNDAPDDSAQTVGGVKFEMVGVPSGSFCMGSTNGDSDEKPVHRVNITSSFYMGKFEVTQAQWEAVMGNNPSSFSDCGGNCPVENVSWDDVHGFIRKINSLQSNHTYRLPTEAEWEYACRAGTTGDYAGNLDSMAWYDSNSGSKTHEVGTKSPNAWGIYDMHGNVWEWVDDWYDSGYYAKSPGTDPTGAATGSNRVARGGGWSDPAGSLRSADRSGDTPSNRFTNLGFRVIRQ